MNALDEARLDAHKFLEGFDPAGDYPERDITLLAAAIVYGRRLGLEEGRDIMFGALERLA